MIVIVALVALLIYLFLGYVFGFAVASHNDILKGKRPITSNKLINFLARPTKEIQGIEKIIFIAGMLIWTIIFFLFVAVPVILAQKIAPNISEYVIYFLVPLMFIGRYIGIKSWKKLPKEES